MESADEYYTQPGLARQCVTTLLRDEWFPKDGTRFLEPSCGAMAWVRALMQAGVSAENIVANDINLSGVVTTNPEFVGVDLRARDFLKADYRGFDVVLGNPPFNDIMSHIEIGLEALKGPGILVYLLPYVWFTANGDANSRRLWVTGAGKPAASYLITPRPKFKETGGTDSAAYGLFVWTSIRHTGKSIFDVIDWYDEREKDRAAEKAAKFAARQYMSIGTNQI
jgi:hypothetical protein